MHQGYQQRSSALPFATIGIALLACGGARLLGRLCYSHERADARGIATMSLQTRRRALHMGMAALTAGAAAPPRPLAALHTSASADADLIRLCGLWQTVSRELDALGETRVTIATEQQTQAEVDRLLARRSEIGTKIEVHLPPKTKEGAAVIAELALDAVNRRNGNYRCLPDVCNQMAWDALGFLYGTEHQNSRCM
jgi:hypothetical protein